MVVRRWDPKEGELSEAALRVRFDEDGYRVAGNVYPPGTGFIGRTRKCTIYVLRGACSLRSGHEGEFSVGDILELEAGDYELRVLGREEVAILTVWTLGSHMN